MFTPIQKLIPGAAGKLGIGLEVEAALICEKYRKLAPDFIHAEVLRHTNPKFYRNKTLVIAVENSSWAHVVISKKEELLKQINASLGRDRVSRIKTEVSG